MSVTLLNNIALQAVAEACIRRGALRAWLLHPQTNGAAPTTGVKFLVEMRPESTLLDLVGLELDLRDLVGPDVEVVEAKGLPLSLRDELLANSEVVCDT